MRAAFFTGSTMFHREANSARLAKALMVLELVVVQDIFPHEGDRLRRLRAALHLLLRMPMKRRRQVGFERQRSVLRTPGIAPPQGCEARDEIGEFAKSCAVLFPSVRRSA
ncbi:MAG: hypothetical protein V8T46_06460 [Sutterella seckii]